MVNRIACRRSRDEATTYESVGCSRVGGYCLDDVIHVCGVVTQLSCTAIGRLMETIVTEIGYF